MSETSKSFWGKLNKSKLKSTSIPGALPPDLLQMFPAMNAAELYRVYHLQCNDSVNQTANYLTRHQPSDHVEDLQIPMATLIESLNDATIRPKRSGDGGPDHFQSTPTHILSHIFSFHGAMTWGVLTRVNRECRWIAKALLARIRTFDFSSFYQNHCHFRSSKHSMRSQSYSVRDDGLKLVSFINAFPDLERMSLRSTHFTKWTSLKAMINRSNMTYLNLSSSLNLYDDDVAFIVEHFPKLNTLDLSHCLELSDLALSHIIEFEEHDVLRKLCLNHLPFVTTNGVRQLLKFKKCIVDLEWKGAKYGNMLKAVDGAVHLRSIDFASALQLERVELTMARQRDGALDLNLADCTKLRFLELDVAHLTSLNVTQCAKLTQIRISSTFQFRSLQCRHCKALELVAVPATTLETVALSGCNALNMELLLDDDNFVMASLSHGAMRSLDLSMVHHLTMDNLDQILQRGKGLKALSVANCKLIPREWMDDIHKRFARPRTTMSVRARKRKQRALDRKSRKPNS